MSSGLRRLFFSFTDVIPCSPKAPARALNTPQSTSSPLRGSCAPEAGLVALWRVTALRQTGISYKDTQDRRSALLLPNFFGIDILSSSNHRWSLATGQGWLLPWHNHSLFFGVVFFSVTKASLSFYTKFLPQRKWENLHNKLHSLQTGLLKLWPGVRNWNAVEAMRLQNCLKGESLPQSAAFGKRIGFPFGVLMAGVVATSLHCPKGKRGEQEDWMRISLKSRYFCSFLLRCSIVSTVEHLSFFSTPCVVSPTTSICWTMRDLGIIKAYHFLIAFRS